MIKITDHKFKISRNDLLLDNKGKVAFYYRNWFKDKVSNFVFKATFELTPNSGDQYIILRDTDDSELYYMRLENLVVTLPFIEKDADKVYLTGVFTFTQKGQKQSVKWLAKEC